MLRLTRGLGGAMPKKLAASSRGEPWAAHDPPTKFSRDLEFAKELHHAGNSERAQTLGSKRPD